MIWLLRRLFRRRLLALAAVALALTGLAAPSASALNPNVSNESRLANLVFSELDSFWYANFRAWGIANMYASPDVGFYNPGPFDSIETACGPTVDLIGNSFYCQLDESVYLDYRFNQAILDRFGDGAAALVLAHEFAHHIQQLLGYPEILPGAELNADCLAGVYFRYAVQYSGLVNRRDVREAKAILRGLAGGDHGTSAQRVHWFDQGFKRYDMDVCLQAF
jgi:hypothetical protein